MKVALISALVVSVLFVAPEASAKPSSPHLTTIIAEIEVAVWKCQDQVAVSRGLPAGTTRTKPSTDPWSLPKSKAYRRWVLNQWRLRYQGCIKTLHSHDAVIRRLQRGLAGSPMAGSEKELERAGRRYGISPYFIAGIAATESSLAVASCSNNPRNAFGLSSCGGGWRVPYFTSWEQAYLFMAKFLTERWPNATTTYHYGGYAACSQCWGSSTARHMAHLFGVGPSVRYN